MPPSVRMIEMKSEVKKFQNEVSRFRFVFASSGKQSGSSPGGGDFLPLLSPHFTLLTPPDEPPTIPRKPRFF